MGMGDSELAVEGEEKETREPAEKRNGGRKMSTSEVAKSKKKRRFPRISYKEQVQ